MGKFSFECTALVPRIRIINMGGFEELEYLNKSNHRRMVVFIIEIECPDNLIPDDITNELTKDCEEVVFACESWRNENSVSHFAPLNVQYIPDKNKLVEYPPEYIVLQRIGI